MTSLLGTPGFRNIREAQLGLTPIFLFEQLSTQLLVQQFAVRSYDIFCQNALRNIEQLYNIQAIILLGAPPP